MRRTKERGMWCERFKVMDHAIVDRNPEEMRNDGKSARPLRTPGVVRAVKLDQ